MLLDTIILLVRNENWPQANLHVTKENKSLKKYIYQWVAYFFWYFVI